MLALPIPDAEVFTLPNGLTLIVEEDHSAPVASIQAWVATGSIHEGRWLGAGLSHLLEHMAFKGTPSRGASVFAQAVQDQGGYLNAYTTFDRTVYWIDTPAAGVPVALELLADALQHSTLPAEELIKEQEVIRREMAMGRDDADRVASQALFETAYTVHPYRHPVIGHLEVFDQLTREDLAAYYRARYVPNNIFFVVAGAVSAAEVHAQLAAHYTAPRAALPDVFLPAEPPQLGRRESHRQFPTELTRLTLAWPGPDMAHPDAPALEVGAVILGHGRSARLYRRLREERELVHSVDAWCWTPAAAGLFGLEALLDPARRSEAEAAMLAGVEEVCTSGVSEAELEKARKQALSHALGALTTMRGKASDLGANWLLARSLRFSHDYLAALERVTTEDVRRALAAHCRPEKLTVVSLNPPGAQVQVVRPAPAVAAGLIERSVLPGGLRLLVRPDARVPLITLAATFTAGLLAENAANNGITRLLAKTLLKGTPTRTAEKLAEEIESVGGGIGSEAGNNSIIVTVRVLRPDLARGLAVLAEVLQKATLPEKAIAREQAAQIAAIQAEEEEPTSVAQHLLRAHLFAGHPYGLRPMGTRESVARLTREDLLAFRDRFLTAENGVLAVFGDVEAAEVRTLAAREFAGLRPGRAGELVIPEPPSCAGGEVVAVRPQQQQAVVMCGWQTVPLAHPDRAALALLDEACSDLGSRLFLRIREELGLAYFVGASQLLGLARGAFTFYLGTDPARLAEVQAVLRAEIAHLAADGLTAAELARAKAKLRGALALRQQSNDALAVSCALDELYGLGFDHYRTWPERLDQVSLAEVRAVAQRYFGEQPGLTAVVRP
jgi:zinc protease